jgi:oxygen-independent coproporphyrinogen-3 oxidase
MIRRSFRKTLYRFTDVPRGSFGKSGYGIYVHVPLCLTKCTFCPFYKELYSEDRKKRYLDAVLKEVSGASIEGEADWIYIGGGTPNTLEPRELSQILGAIGEKIEVNTVGVELLPALLDRTYLHELERAGFTKVSMGIESFSEAVITKTNRTLVGADHQENMIMEAKSAGLSVNADMMVGLPNQDDRNFLNDISRISKTDVDQITIYPFMTIRGVSGSSGISEDRQFQLIERAANLLKDEGFERRGIWTFAKTDDVYDSSRDELVQDYAGFGPGAFSTYGDWKVVNPELEPYIWGLRADRKMAFVARKTKGSDDWRRFARSLYDLNMNGNGDYPHKIRLFNSLLRIWGYGHKRSLSRKGIMLSHHISKTVVESLPFPIQNPECVENYGVYESLKREITA